MISEVKYKTILGKGHRSQWAKRIKILTPKQMLKRLPIDFAQIKEGNRSENLLNEVR